MNPESESPTTYFEALIESMNEQADASLEQQRRSKREHSYGWWRGRPNGYSVDPRIPSPAQIAEAERQLHEWFGHKNYD